MSEEITDPFLSAIQESGGRVVDQESSPSAEEQGQQPSTNEQPNTDATIGSTENTLSETQEAVGDTDSSVAESSIDENPTQEAGEVKKKSRIIDLNTNSDESDSLTPVTEGTSNTEESLNVSEMFGEDFKSLNDVHEYAQGLESLIKELETKESTPTYANEFVQKMDEYVRNGGDPVYFAKVNSVKVDDLSPMEALKLDLQWEHNISDEEAEAFINHKYNLDEYDESLGEVNPNSIQLKIDSTNAKKNLMDRQADNTLVDVKPSGLSEEEWAAKEKEAFAEKEKEDDIRMWDENNGWAKEVDKTIDTLKTQGIGINLGNNKLFNFAYDKDDSYTEELISRIDQALYDSGLSKNDNPDYARELAENIFLLDNKDEIFRSYAEEIRSMKAEEYFKMSHNPSSISRGDQVPTSDKGTLSAEEQISKLWNQ